MKQNPKKLLRKAAKQTADQDLEGAIESYKKVLSDFPGNRQATEGLEAISQKLPDNNLTSNESDAVNLVLKQVNQGEFLRASDLADGKLKQYPKSVSLLNLAGAIKAKLGNHKGAVLHLEEAQSLNPSSKEVLSNLGAAYNALGDNVAAINSYEKALKISPEEKSIHFNLGNCLRNQGKLEAAAGSYRRAIELDSGYAEALNNLGLVLQLDSRVEEAIQFFKKAIAVKPSYIEALQNLASSELRLGNFTGSLEIADRVINLDSGIFEAYCTKGNALHGMKEFESAVEQFQIAAELNPENFDNLVNLSEALLKSGKHLASLEICDRALSIDSDTSKIPHNNRGAALKELGRYAEALMSYEKAIEIDPNFGEGHYNIAIILAELCEFEESFLHYDRAIALNPDFIAAYSNKLFALNYDPRKTPQEIFDYYVEFDEKFSEPHTPLWKKDSINLRGARKIRIGYVSPDFRKHSARHFIEPLFDAHDKQKFEIVAYSEVRIEDAVTSKLRERVDAWVSTWALNDKELAERIVADDVDILVDLAGHTSGNRLLMMGKYKPAPVQVSFMGYGYTTGIKAIDYFFTDINSTPTDADKYYAEKPWRLSTNYAYRPDPLMGPVSPLPALEKKFITFGSFSRIIRLNSRTIKTWSEILRIVPESKLVINSGDLKFSELRAWIANQFNTQGITEDRLLLGFDSPPWDVIRDIDISLDCFPHNSGLTLLESLYMGVPYVTLASRPGTGRLGASFLVALGREEWIAYNEKDYVDKAVNLAKDYQALGDLREALRPQMEASHLRDETNYTLEIETAYQNMWELFRREHTRML